MNEEKFDEELQRKVFGGMTEKEYRHYWKWQAAKGNLLAGMAFLSGFALFLLLAALLKAHQ